MAFMCGKILKSKWQWSALFCGLFSSSALASGFALIEQSASGQGLSYAGAAANPEDASVMWFNPAGLTQISSNQLIAAGHVIAPNAAFKNQGSYIKGVGPLYGVDDDGAQVSFVPNVYWKTQWQGLDVGLGINVPFGSSVEYDEDWVGRYHAVYTSTQTLNINPAIAKKINNQLSLGAGLNAQYIDVNLTQKIDFGLSSIPQTNDGYADLQADGWGFGFNLGALYTFANQAKLGLAYRSKVSHDATGEAKFTTPATYASDPNYATQAIDASVALPDSASLSLRYPLNSRINILADTTWMGWSSFDELRIEFANKADSVQPEEWENVWRYSLGATYAYNDQLTLRTGVAFDESPIPNRLLRTPRIPDNDRTWLSVGFGYALNKAWHLDVGYSHLWGGKTAIEATDADTEQHVLVGEFDTSVDILSAQIVWNY